jgi:hypothetical protein
MQASPAIQQAAERMRMAEGPVMAASDRLRTVQWQADRELVEHLAWSGRAGNRPKGSLPKIEASLKHYLKTNKIDPAVRTLNGAQKKLAVAQSEHTALVRARYMASTSRGLGVVALAGGLLEAHHAINQFQHGRTASGITHLASSAGQLAMSLPQLTMGIALRASPGLAPKLMKAGAIGAGVALAGAVGSLIADA